MKLATLRLVRMERSETAFSRSKELYAVSISVKEGIVSVFGPTHRPSLLGSYGNHGHRISQSILFVLGWQMALFTLYYYHHLVCTTGNNVLQTA